MDGSGATHRESCLTIFAREANDLCLTGFYWPMQAVESNNFQNSMRKLSKFDSSVPCATVAPAFHSPAFVLARQFGFLNSSDAVSCFIGLVLEKLDKEPRHILPIMPDLLPALEYVAENQASFEAEESIYGNFLEKVSRIKSLYAPYANS